MHLEIKAGFAERKNAVKNGVTEFKNHTANVKKKILLSAGLGAVIFGVNWGAIPVVVVKSSELMSTDLNTGLVLGLAYGVNIISVLINANQQRRLLENERIDLSQDLSATVIFHALGKINLLKEKRKERSIAAVSAPTATSIILSTVLRESTFLSLVAIFPERAKELVMLKSMQGGSNLIQAGGAEFFLRILGREKKKTQSLSTSGVVVNMNKKQ